MYIIICVAVSYVNVKPPIPVAEFATHVSKMKTKKGFQTEYEVS